jgi:hypothetical protein
LAQSTCGEALAGDQSRQRRSDAMGWTRAAIRMGSEGVCNGIVVHLNYVVLD